MKRMIPALMVSRTPALDANALAFLTATGITDATITTAINKLVLDLKGYGLWNNALAYYPLVGGTSATCAVNLRSPGTYNLSYIGAPVFASTGMTPSDTGYADTGLLDTTATIGAFAMGYYSRTNNTVAGIDIGVDDSASFTQELLWYSSGPWIRSYLFHTGPLLITPAATTQGLLSTVSIATDGYVYINGAFSGNFGSVSDSPGTTGASFYIGGVRNGPFSCQRECAFAYFYGGLFSASFGVPSTDETNLYTAIQTFNTTLGRQV